MNRSQSPDGRICPKTRVFGPKFGTSSMPTLLSCFCMTSKASARSWLPLVVVKRKLSLPTLGQLQMAEFDADGVSGPPVHLFFFRRAMTAFWLNLYCDQYGLYCACCGKNTLFWSTGRSFADFTRPVRTHRASTICARLIPITRAWRTYFCFRAGAPFGPRWMSTCCHWNAGVVCTENFEFLYRSAIWICGCGDMAWISPAWSAWNSDGVLGMKRNTILSSFAAGPAFHFGFFTMVSCVPFVQLWNLKGPLDRGMEFNHMLLKSAAFCEFMIGPTCWRGMSWLPAMASQKATGLPFLNIIVTDLPLALTLWMSSQPVRSVMSKFGFMITL